MTDIGQKLYAILQQAGKKEIKRANWRKALAVLAQFETAFIGEQAMVGATRKLLKAARQLPTELEDHDVD